MKNYILISTLMLFFASCTKIEDEKYDCIRARKPTLSNTVFNTTLGGIVKVESDYYECIWVGPNNLRLTGKSVTIPISSLACAGEYKVFAYTQACITDSASFTINVSGTNPLSCSPTPQSYTVDGFTLTQTQFYRIDTDFSSYIVSDRTCLIKFLKNVSFYDAWLNFEFPNKKIPTPGMVYFVDSTYTSIPKDNQIVIHGSNDYNGTSFIAKSGSVYCTQSGNDIYFTFCDVVVKMGSSRYSTLSGKVVY
jgi:hypothetical protein